jgi:[ribosomal protein S18]-alanine N-acetyltransferase
MTPAQQAALHALCFTSPRPWSHAEFSDLNAVPGVFLVHDAGQGFVIGRAIAGEAELLTIAVHPEARRQGIAQTLLAAYETEARRRDASESFLEVAADNIAAISLYEGAGYRESGRRKGYYHQPDGRKTDALLMVKHLADASSRA